MWFLEGVGWYFSSDIKGKGGCYWIISEAEIAIY